MDRLRRKEEERQAALRGRKKGNERATMAKPTTNPFEISFGEIKFDFRPIHKDPSFGRSTPAPKPKSETGPNVSWDDIVGLDDAKEALREAIEYPVTHANLYSGYGKEPSRGVLLYGPPGCGKTLLAKAVATAVQRRGSPVATSPSRVDMFGIPMTPNPVRGFISVKGSEILDAYVGGSEKKVRELFTEARSYERATGQRAVIFIDEAEALLSCRSSSRTFLSSMCVPTFLAEMDGVDGSSAFIILSTNRVDTLDSAITRDGRIDVKVEVSRPRRDAVRQMLELHLRRVPVSGDGIIDEACADIFSGRHVVTRGFAGETEIQLCLDDVLSGAVVAGIVKRATSHAIRRDREAGLTNPSGVQSGDFSHAVRSAALEMKDLNWREELHAKAMEVMKAEVIHDVAQHATGVAN